MPIRDLLWACPICRTYAAIRPDGPTETCTNCRARFERADRARIRVSTATRNEIREPIDWEPDLPPIDALPENGLLGPEPVLTRMALAARPVRVGHRLIGWAERFSPRIPGEARLDPETLHIHIDGGSRLDWRLDEIEAIQPSSSTLQIRCRRTLVSVRFQLSSVRRWEAVLCETLRRRYRATGRGVITEFQPGIRTAR
jgi:hypothetical protein